MVSSLKRKQPARPAPEDDDSDSGTGSESENFAMGTLNGALDGEDDEDDEDEDQDTDFSDEEEFEGLEDLESDDDDEEDEEDDEVSTDDEGKKVDHDGDEEMDDSLPPGTRIITDSEGNKRYMYPEINPVYDSDDTDQEDGNTIGNVPLSMYDMFPHIGYDINGKKIMRPATGKALDTLLESIDLPKGWTGMVDKNTGKPLKLTDEELDIVSKIQQQLVPRDGEGDYDPYEPTVEWFSSKTEIMPLSSAPEPKRRFVPSKHEAKRVMKIVRAIREGRIVPNKPKQDDTPKVYDIWADEAPVRIDKMALPAPKLPPPTHDESYNPPREYLPTEEERKKWEEMDPEDRPKDYIPRAHNALRLVPGYNRFVKERFERCLDLYLAPRIRRKKLDIDPESLLPKLPSPQDLKPFPSACANVYRGHKGRVRSLAVDPSGIWLASGGDDGTVRLWEIITAREVWRVKIGDDEAVNCVRWRPTREGGILAAAAGDDIFLLVPPIFDPATEILGQEIIAAGWGYAAANSTKEAPTATPAATWTPPSTNQAQNGGIGAIIHTNHAIKHIAWHRRGDYFATSSSTPNAASRAVLIHQLTRHKTQPPFRRSRGAVSAVEFHPFKPQLLVATQRNIRVYDLAQQKQIRTLTPGSRWLSSIAIHPQTGDHVLAAGYDKRVLWHDLDMGTKPYKTLRYHDRAVRSVGFHPQMPLWASGSDDGRVHVFYGRVDTNNMDGALVVPLKMLKGHKIESGLGVLGVEWHTKAPWVFSCGADGTVRQWT